MLKDYDMSVLYYPGKANVVAEALSRMAMGSVSHIEEVKKELLRDVHRLSRLGVRLEDSLNGSCMVHHNFDLSLLVEMQSRQLLDEELMVLKESVLGKLNESFSLGRDGVLMYQGRLYLSK